MAIYYRRILDEPQYYNLPKFQCDDDVDECPTKNEKGSNSNSNSNLPFSPILLVAICFLVAIFFLICYLIVLKKYKLNLRNIRRSVLSDMNDQRDENVMNQDHGPELIHPIWLINTIGLQQMVIDSIAIVKYKKGEGLVEEADCTICLSEFEDDESLRLLPKCSHAFHIACIDTWLRSHKNCPLCRAPIVVDTSSVEATNGDGLSAREDDFTENLDSNGDLQRRQDGDENSGAMVSTDEETNPSENIDKALSSYQSVRNCDVGVQNKEGGSQEVRRSVSLDSSSALMIRIAVANIDPLKVAKHSNNKSLSRIYGAMKSSSFRHFSEKRQVSMKRTFSSGRRRSRSSKSHESILPS